MKNTTYVNPDMLYKQGMILKYIEDYNLQPINVLDIGAGHTNLSLYLIKNYKVNYLGIDSNPKLKKGFFECIEINDININKKPIFSFNNQICSCQLYPKYEAKKFFNFTSDEKYDLIYDVCALIHFDVNQIFCKNDGLYKAGLTIKNLLTDDGIFIFVSDCFKEGSYKEFIKPEECLKCFLKSGLKLVPNTSTFCPRENIKKYTSNNIFNLHSCEEIEKSFPGIITNDSCATHDVIFYVFKK